MTTIDLGSQSALNEPDHDVGSRTARTAPLAAWLTTSDHKRLGRMMAGVGLLGLLGVAVVSLLMGIARGSSSDGLTVNEDYAAQLFAIMRYGLVFFAVLPVLLGIAVAVVPLQLGARSLAFPRLAAAGFWTWFFGLVLVIVSIAANGGPGGGAEKYVSLFIASFGVMIVGIVAVAGSLATTVMTTRAPGMNMRRVPLFCWSVLVASLGLVLMLPVAFGAVVYLYVSNRYNPAPFGGSEGINGFLNFALTQPQTYIYALPAIGLLVELLPVATRRRMPLRGVVIGALSLVGVAALSGVSQVSHDLAWSGSGLNFDRFGNKFDDLIDFGFFNVLPVLGVVVILLILPLAVRGARLAPSAPLLFALLGLLLILTGMVGGVLENVVDLGLQGTTFEEGSFVLVSYGALLAGFGALVYWGPKLWGRLLGDKEVLPLALLGALGAALAGLPMYIAGFADQPAQAVNFDYSGPQSLWNVLSGIGHGLFALTTLAFVALALKGFTKGQPAGDDPWNAQTLEWATSSPAPHDNFGDVHTVMSAEPLVDLKPISYSGEGNS